MAVGSLSSPFATSLSCSTLHHSSGIVLCSAQPLNVITGICLLYSVFNLVLWEMVMGLATSCTHDCDERNGRTRRQCKNTNKHCVFCCHVLMCMGNPGHTNWCFLFLILTQFLVHF